MGSPAGDDRAVWTRWCVAGGGVRLVVPVVVCCVVFLAAPLFAQDPTDRPPLTFETDLPPEPGAPEVERVRFIGVRALDESLLRQSIVTRQSECRSPLFFLFCRLGADWAQRKRWLDREEVERDVERLEILYEAWGYPDAEVSVRVIEENEEDVTVEFTVVEGEPILVESLVIVGLDRLTPPVEVERPLPLREGEPYALPLLEETEQRIVRAFAERGHPYVEIEIGGDVDAVARRARVVLTVDPGPLVVFGEAEIEVERPVDEEVIRERLAFSPGEPYSPSALEETQRALYALPVIERVVLVPVGLETGATVVRPRIVVEARRISAIQVEGTISSTECLEAAAFWRNRYFLGGPRLFSIGVGISNLFADQLRGNFPCTSTGDDDEEDAFSDPNYFVQADLRQPWPGSPRTAVQLGAFYRRESAPRAYAWNGYGARIGVAREFRPDLTGTVLYSPQRNDLVAADAFLCGNYGVCTEEELDDLTDFRWLSPIEVFGIWTPTGPPVALVGPQPGVPWRRWARAGVEGATFVTGSEWDYVRGIGEAALTRVFGAEARFEVAGRTRAGLLAGEDVLPPQLRLYSGGVNTVRGVPQNFLGPKILFASESNARELGCEIVPGGCPEGIVVDPDRVSARPTGGDLVAELNLEARYWLTNTFQVAAFADFGVIGRTVFGGSGDGFVDDDWGMALTPGVGFRILTGLGPIRIDLGYDPSGADSWPLLTRDPETRDILFLGDVVYDPWGWDDPGSWRRFWRRLELHVAIGQAF